MLHQASEAKTNSLIARFVTYLSTLMSFDSFVKIQAWTLRWTQAYAQYIWAVRTGQWRRATGLVGQLMVLGIVIIMSVVLAIVVYQFIAIGTSIGTQLNTDQKGNISQIGNQGAQTLNFLPLLALVIIVGLILAVLLGVFLHRRE